jgi:hypothetical protein
MRSVKFDFGTQESPREGKGLDWMLDPFYKRKLRDKLVLTTYTICITEIAVSIRLLLLILVLKSAVQ